MFSEAVGLSLVASLISYEVTGLSPGGLIVPGYVALLAGRPSALLTLTNVLVTSLVTLGLVRFVSRYTILFSRRRFVVMVITGFAVLRGLELAWPALLSGDLGLQGLGYLVPGLIANDMEKQGTVPTLLAVAAVSGILRVVLAALAWGGLL